MPMFWSKLLYVLKYFPEFRNKTIEESVETVFPNELNLSEHLLWTEVLPPGILPKDLSSIEKERLIHTSECFEKARKEANIAIDVNTYHRSGSRGHRYRGLRLEVHQKALIKSKLTKTPYSRTKHKGWALDVSSKLPIYVLAEIFRKHFNTVLIYPNKRFLHVDTELRGGKKLYGKSVGNKVTRLK